MPTLASFIPYRPRLKSRSSKSPFSIRRFDSFSSPHPYASPEILDINEISIPKQTSPPLQQIDEVRSQSHPTNAVNTSEAKHGTKSPPSPLRDWFPPDFLKTEPLTLGLDGESTGKESDGRGDAGKSGNATAMGGNGMQGEGDRNGTTEKTEESEESSSTSENMEEIVANLEAMDASNFVNVVDPEEGSPASLHSSETSSKKPMLAPITIPKASLHGPKVQIIRSPVAEPQDIPQSRPDSQMSASEISAISGTTLARQLGNSFELSGDNRTSRHRSGISTTVRQDSATLPRGEYPFLHSPYWGDRKSLGEVVSAPHSGVFEIPPVPPVPAGLLHTPRAPRHSGPDPRDKPRVIEPIRRASTSSSRSQSGSDSEGLPSSLIRSDGGSPAVAIDLPNLRTISPTSEATSSGLNGPNSTTGSSCSLSSSAHNTANHESKPSDLLSTTSTNPIPRSPGQVSTSSTKDIDNVLDYYQFDHTPSPDANFRTPFSPITEESNSQRSSPSHSLFRRDNQDSKWNSPTRKLIPATSSSRGRLDWTHSRNSSDPRFPRSVRNSNQPRPPLLPIGERPQSFQLPQSPFSAGSKVNATPTPALSSSAPSNSGLVPPSRSIFNRQRSGSAPSPIKVVRDSKDCTAYNLTVTPLVENSASSTPTTGNSDVVQQTFPETPNTSWTPILSTPGHMSKDSNDHSSPTTPWTPKSATPLGIQPSLAQQVLLTRAATSVQGARHLRQTSGSRLRTVAKPYVQPISPLTPPQDDEFTTADVSASPTYSEPIAHTSQDCDESLPVHPEPSHSYATPTFIHDEATSLLTLSEPRSAYSDSTSLHNEAVSGGPSTASISVYSGIASGYSGAPSVNNGTVSGAPSSDSLPEASSASIRMKPLPPMPSRPSVPLPSPSSPSESTAIQSPLNLPFPNPLSAHAGSSIGASAAAEPVQTPTPAVTPVVASQAHRQLTPPPLATPPVLITPPPPSHRLSPSSPSTLLFSPIEIDSGDSLSASFGSPPPYSTVMYDRQINNDNLTPSTGGSGPDPNFRFGAGFSPNSSSPMTNIGEEQFSPNGTRRMRTRPPLPIGPRRPSQHGGNMSPAVIGGMTQGMSAVGSSMPNGHRLYPAPSSSPKFQTPPLKWRGYTMDAAKWTFTSTQLQDIVSRAIRQSAEASAIRLLHLETLDNDIPEEMHRLEMQRTDVKTRYKMLTRRRAALFGRLSNHINGSQPEDTVSAMQLVDDLREVSVSLDKLAEDLHSTDEQISQLNSLREVHSASALAMALRKLNASFLKQFAESRALRMHVETLEAERDEAWKQAEDVANDYDHLSEKVVTRSADPSNRRSSRVVAVRKSSLRVSKAGLRSSGILRSQRSSASSAARTSLSNLPSSTKSMFSPEDMPPVPPMPHRRPVNIETDLPTRVSVGVSTGGPTPSSETRAMMRAQEELYDMLGIPMNGRRGLRRSRSMSGPNTELEVTSRSPTSLDQRPRSDISSRPLSFPGDSGFSDVYSVMTANRNAMLVTLGMLSN